MQSSQAEDSVGLYPMRLVTRLTGLSADTIRAWERRHGAVTPSRSSGNTRRFTATEVRRLVLLREATEGGHSIRSIAPLGLHELERLVERQDPPLRVVAQPESEVAADAGLSFGELRGAYLGALARFDTRRAFDLLMRGATFLDRLTFVLKVVHPIVREVYERCADHPLGAAQARVLDGQLRSVLTALLRLNPPGPSAERVILTAVEGHTREDLLLVAALLSTAHGKDPIYIGPGLTIEDAEWTVRMSRANVLLVALDREVHPGVPDRLAALVARLPPTVQVWCGAHSGATIASVAAFDAHFSDLDTLNRLFKGL